jgi:hypothetical protein
MTPDSAALHPGYGFIQAMPTNQPRTKGVTLVTRGLAFLALFHLLLIHACSPPPEFKEPEGFGGLNWEASIEQLQKFFDAHIYVQDAEFEIERSNYNFKGMPVVAEFAFIRGRFLGVRLLFQKTSYDKMTEILKAQYGPPTTEFAEKAGWLGKQSSVYLIKGTDENSVARIETKQLTEFYSARIKAMTDQAKYSPVTVAPME